jgi:hypothetical protein
MIRAIMKSMSWWRLSGTKNMVSAVFAAIPLEEK